MSRELHRGSTGDKSIELMSCSFHNLTPISWGSFFGVLIPKVLGLEKNLSFYFFSASKQHFSHFALLEMLLPESSSQKTRASHFFRRISPLLRFCSSFRDFAATANSVKSLLSYLRVLEEEGRGPGKFWGPGGP